VRLIIACCGRCASFLAQRAEQLRSGVAPRAKWDVPPLSSQGVKLPAPAARPHRLKPAIRPSA